MVNKVVDDNLNIPLRDLLWFISNLKKELVNIEKDMERMDYEANIFDKKGLAKLQSLSIKREVSNAKIDLLCLIISQYSDLKYDEINGFVEDWFLND